MSVLDANACLMLQNVRVSYPHLFTKPIIKGEEGKYGAVFMLDKTKDAAQISACQSAIEEAVAGAEALKGRRPAPDKLFLRDGDLGDRDQYFGHWTVNANNDSKPLVLSKHDHKHRIENPDDDQVYAGCYVNAKIRVWVQNNQYGRRVNAQLIAIQFAGEGEAFSAGYIAPETAMAGFEATADASDWG